MSCDQHHSFFVFPLSTLLCLIHHSCNFTAPLFILHFSLSIPQAPAQSICPYKHGLFPRVDLHIQNIQTLNLNLLLLAVWLCQGTGLLYMWTLVNSDNGALEVVQTQLAPFIFIICVYSAIHCIKSASQFLHWLPHLNHIAGSNVYHDFMNRI